MSSTFLIIETLISRSSLVTLTVPSTANPLSALIMTTANPLHPSEEVVSNHYSSYPSPDSKFVLFTKTNATGVKHVRFPIYGEDSYAKILDYEYPKVCHHLYFFSPLIPLKLYITL